MLRSAGQTWVGIPTATGRATRGFSGCERARLLCGPAARAAPLTAPRLVVGLCRGRDSRWREVGSRHCPCNSHVAAIRRLLSPLTSPISAAPRSDAKPQVAGMIRGVVLCPRNRAGSPFRCARARSPAVACGRLRSPAVACGRLRSPACARSGGRKRPSRRGSVGRATSVG